MAVGASIGSPATPGVGIVILSITLTSIGVPASGIALIMGVDRILDMSRTAINVTGDLVAARLMDSWIKPQEESGTEQHSTIMDAPRE
jgi:Na+/H+-dicarboxylate symporters